MLEALSDAGAVNLVTVNVTPGSGFPVMLSVLMTRMMPIMRSLMNMHAVSAPAVTMISCAETTDSRYPCGAVFSRT